MNLPNTKFFSYYPTSECWAWILSSESFSKLSSSPIILHFFCTTLSSFITAGTADTDNKSEDNSVLLCYSLTAALIHMILVTMQAFTLTILAVLHFLTIQYYVHNFCKQAPTLTIDALY